MKISSGSNTKRYSFPSKNQKTKKVKKKRKRRRRRKKKSLSYLLRLSTSGMLKHREKSYRFMWAVQDVTSAEPSGSCSVSSMASIQTVVKTQTINKPRTMRFQRTSSSLTLKEERWSLEAYS